LVIFLKLLSTYLFYKRSSTPSEAIKLQEELNASQKARVELQRELAIRVKESEKAKSLQLEKAHRLEREIEIMNNDMIRIKKDVDDLLESKERLKEDYERKIKQLESTVRIQHIYNIKFKINQLLENG
jgi:hypothetical protein